MKVVFENESIKVSETGHDYDFVATIENKTDKTIIMSMDKEEADEEVILNPIVIPANDWIGLTNWEYEGNTQLALSWGRYEIKAVPQLCCDCQYVGDKYSFPLPNDKQDIDKDNPLIKHYYCCCGDCNQYEKDVSIQNIQQCDQYDNIDT